MAKAKVSYTQMVDWVLDMDDVEEILDTEVPISEAALIAPVTVSMISDLFDTPMEKIVTELRKRHKEKQHGF